MFVSIGSKCSVRESIQRYLKLESMQTNLFDFNLTNFETIVYILENIDNEFKADDFYDLNEICADSRMLNHKLLRLDTVHDFNISKPYDEEMINFINKYNRRLKRLKNIIMSNVKIEFIHLFDINFNFRIPNEDIYIPTIEQVNRFIMAIKNINENCQFNIHFLIPPNNCVFYNKNYNIDTNKLNELKISNNVFIHQLEEDINVDPNEHQ
jgi:hypothetical protein